MTQATPDQVMDRLRKLPPSLWDGFYSLTIDRDIVAIAVAAGCSDAQQQELLRISGLVFVGFIHPDAVALEIQEALGLEKEKSAALAAELGKKVYAPYRKDMEQVYAPPGPVPPDSPIYSDYPDTPSAPLVASLSPQPLPARPKVADMTLPKPAPLPPVTTGKQNMPMPPVPAPSLHATPSPLRPSPEPFIMRSSPVAEQAVKSSAWKIDLNSDLFKQSRPSTSGGQAAPGMKPAMPPRPAQLEMGPVPAPSLHATPSPLPPSSIPHTISPEARVVHYADLKVPAGIQAAPAPAPAPKINPFLKAPIVPPAPKPAPAAPANLPVAPRKDIPPTPPQPFAPLPTAPAAEPKKPPKIVNFGPEGDLK